MKPNLFILGAPKCGTTALATWLAEHPEIFVSPTKEPHYFSTEYQIVRSLGAYEQLFAAALPQHRWRCEASVWQMYSPVAARNILNYERNARFVVMLRNPIEMVPSMHRQQCLNSNELVHDLDKALDLNDVRKAGGHTGTADGYPPDHLAYLHSCALGWQVRRLMQIVPREQLHVIVHDDMNADPAKMYRGVLEFLGVSAFTPKEFQRVHVAKVRRLWWLDRVVRNVGRWKARSGIKARFGLLASVRKWNRREARIEAPSAATRARLVEALREDICDLEEILGRDLSHWTADTGPR